MGNKKQTILALVIGTLFWSNSQSLFAQEQQEPQEPIVLASTIIQQKYVKRHWQESGGVLMIVVDAIAPNAWSNDYQRIVYFRYIDEQSYMSSLSEVASDTCKEDLKLDMDNTQKSVAQLNASISMDNQCAASVYDAQLYAGFLNSKQEINFQIDGFDNTSLDKVYDLINTAFKYVRSHITINNKVSLEKINTRYNNVRTSMNKEKFDTRLTRNSLSGFRPLLTKIKTYCDLSVIHEEVQASKDRWARLGARVSNLSEDIAMHYGSIDRY